WYDWSQPFFAFQWYFGLLLPTLCGLLAVVLLFRGRQRTLLVMLILGTLAGVLGFLQIQGPGAPHFYLLMPLLGGLPAAGAILLARQIGSKLTFLILLASGWVLGLAPHHNNRALRAVQPAGVDLWPYRDANADELGRLGRWLESALGPD